MAGLVEIARERTELSDADVEHLLGLVAEWTILADLGFSDLVLWLPTWNEGGLVAAAAVRPTTSPTNLSSDVVGDFAPRGRRPVLDRALTTGRIVAERRGELPVPTEEEGIPVVRDGRTIAVLGRLYSGRARATGDLERVYLVAADELAGMVAEGEFPPRIGVAETGRSPRVGDGLIRVDVGGRVEYATPNAMSVFHRLGLAVDLVGRELAPLVARLVRRPGPVDEAVALVASGATAGSVDVENAGASVAMRSVPLLARGRPVGGLILVRDVTDLRRRDRALLTKDATIREIHHRVKNNLQTVAALLRLQSRRLESPEARLALAEAVARIGTIAVVHETLSHGAGESVAFDEVLDRITDLVRDLSPDVSVSRAEVGELPAELATPLALVLTELLANAAEHGGRRVAVGAERGDGDARNWLELSVTDEARPESDPATAAELGEEPQWSQGGSGLGLQIVRTLVSAELRGSIEFRTTEGGTRVYVRVPLVRPDERGPAGSGA